VTEASRHRDRYLQLLKDALLDRHHLANEVRLEYLASLPPGAEPDAESLRDPARTLEVRFKRVERSREAGDPKASRYPSYAQMSRRALDHLEAALVDVAARHVPGDLVEVGVGRGGGGILLRACLDAYEIGDRSLWLVDPFLAGARSGADEHGGRIGVQADLSQVRDGFERFRLFDDRIRIVHGAYDDALADAPIGPIALLRIGTHAAYDLGPILRRLLPRVSPGGTVIVEGVGRPPIANRLDAFRRGRGLVAPFERVDGNTVAWRVDEPTADTEPEGTGDAAAPRPLHRVPLPSPVHGERLDLSVVVVFHDMAREAARTLTSLTRWYQEGIEHLAYEVLVIDNGSHPDQRLDAADVASYGPELRLLDPADAPPSPTVALNRGIAESRGEVVAVMIDGAHVLTPGVLRNAMVAMRTYEPAVVAIQQWYVGPGQQGDAQQAGYDQVAEDRLFAGIRWPTDGYRLFEIGHFIGDRDWFDGIVESNCLFAPRSLLEQVGGFDDSFDLPGGGYANLELFERLHTHPGINPVSVLGEGTFHQFHGGTTTNVADEAQRRARIVEYGEHFRRVRGRPLLGLNKPIHYVGAMDTKAARRTRSRREFLLRFDPDRDPVNSTRRPPQPVPEELKLAAIEALWDHQAWREATWLGAPVARFPTDLHTYQELFTQLRPPAAVLLGEDEGLGGRALHLASLAELLGHGRVLAVGSVAGGDRPQHARLRYLDADPTDPGTVEDVAGWLDGEGALVFVGLGATERVAAAFEAYSPFVDVGGYVVVESTVVNGRPAAPGFGPGPHEAVSALLRRHPEFVPDPALERYTVTFNKHGYLRRTSGRA
jgi:cephalosporin hydroxylase